MALIDELLDAPQPPARAFLLDGQTVVLEDYLEVRPERASELAAALRAKTIEAGPWFVLADELIPSGEGLVRNLLAGQRTLRALRASAPPVLYCPDSFGHPAALPTIARGFDKPLVIAWRGYSGSSRSSVARWIAPGGDDVLLYHLTRSGYELGASLPVNLDAARIRWQRIRDEIASRGSPGVELLLNGADHHARQRNVEKAIDSLRDVAAPDVVEPSTLTRFGAELEQLAVRTDPPRVRGELRDSYGYTWTLQGTLASRTAQKRRYVRCEREMLRDVEPWTALVRLSGGASARHLTNVAWRQLLLCQPHDTLCGCSIDQVARAMDYRLEGVAAQAIGLREQALFALAGHDPDEARTRRDAWKPLLLLRNRAPRSRSGVAVVELTAWIADAPAGPGSATPAIPDIAMPPVPKLADGGTVQVLARSVAHERIEAPRGYPDNDEVLRVSAAIWLEDVPGYAIAGIPLGKSRSVGRKPRPVTVAKDGMSNDRIRVRFGADGAVTLEQDGRIVEPLLAWESRADVGDLYTPAIRDEKLTPRLLATRVLHRGPLRGTVEQRWRLLGEDGRIDVRVRFVLDAEASWLRLQISGDNAARDHRLRLRVRTDVEGGTTWADAAFGPIEREPANVALEHALIELPVLTAPLHRYVSRFNRDAGATLFSDGLTEYETDGSEIAVTLLRSVGELSRNDLPERPGNAGWPAATPEAQGIGPFEAELALMLHGARSVETLDEIERAADDVLHPLTGETVRSALAVPDSRPGITLDGAALAFSSVKESEDGEWIVLRCVNLADVETRGTWKLGRAPHEAQLARLDETPTGPVSVLDDRVRFVAPPRAVVTILVR